MGSPLFTSLGGRIYNNEKKVILKNMLLFLFTTLVIIGIPISHADNPSLRSINSVTVWPEVPLPNQSVGFKVVASNVSYVKIQICVNDMCFMPVNMNSTGNDTYVYTFVPGTGNYPATYDGDVIEYHILTDNEEYDGNLTVRENNPPQIGDVVIDNKYPHLGDNITVGVNIADDFGVHNATCYLKTNNLVEKYNMSENGTFYYITTKLLYEGSYFVKIITYDNSNQSNFTTGRFYVYPQNPTDTSPPEIVDAYGIQNGTSMMLKVYIEDESGVVEARAFVIDHWYPLKEVKEGLFEAITNVSSNITIYAKDPYNNTTNTTLHIKIYNKNKVVMKNGSGEIDPLLLIALGALIGLLVFVPVKSHFFVILIAIFAVSISLGNSMHIISVNAGGNIYNGNTCWSCLGLQPHSNPNGWLVNYPNGSNVPHPDWVKNMLMDKPLLIYVHQVPCTGCEIQWKDMIKNGIIDENGNLTWEYRGKINFIVLDATYGSPTRTKAMNILRIYSIGLEGTPTTVILTKKNGKIYWYSKSGIMYSQELKKFLGEAIELYGD